MMIYSWDVHLTTTLVYRRPEGIEDFGTDQFCKRIEVWILVG